MNRFVACVLCTCLILSIAVEVKAAPAAYGLSYRNPLGGANPAYLWNINPVTGAASGQLALHGVTGTGGIVNDRSVCDIVQAPDGTYYVLNDHYAGVNSDAIRMKDSLMSLDPTTGVVTRIGDVFPTGTYVYEGDMAFQPGTGVLYACQSLNHVGRLYTINTATGAGTTINANMAINDASGLAFAPDGSLYVLDTGGGLSSNPPAVLDKIDPATGNILSSITLNLSLGTTAAMDVNPLTGTIYVGDGDLYGTNNLYTLGPVAGILTLVGPTGIPGSAQYNMGGGLAGLVLLPEPMSLGLVLLGGLMLIGRRR